MPLFPDGGIIKKLDQSIKRRGSFSMKMKLAEIAKAINAQNEIEQ